MLCDSEEPALAFGGPVAAVSNIVAVEQVQAIPTSVLFHTFAHLLQPSGNNHLPNIFLTCGSALPAIHKIG